MLEKIKVIPFVDESAAVKLCAHDGKLTLERNTRVLWAAERTALPVEGIDCYVEAEKFFALLPNIRQLTQDTCLNVALANGAKYQLPFLSVSWDEVNLPAMTSPPIDFKISDLMLCTLKNLVKPELQCIYIDEHGAVSCDFISACISTAVKSEEPFLLPPDVQELISGTRCQVQIDTDKIYIAGPTFRIVTSKPTLSEDAWWESLRAMLDGAEEFTKAAQLQEGLKRLAIFADFVSFEADKVLAGTNFEPFSFKRIPEKQYGIEHLRRILDTATDIGEKDGNLVLKNATNKFLIAPMEEEE